MESFSFYVSLYFVLFFGVIFCVGGSLAVVLVCCCVLRDMYSIMKGPIVFLYRVVSENSVPATKTPKRRTAK